MPNLPRPVKILKASAGSGKTHSLTSYYLNLLFSVNGDSKFREILAVTFTNKATEEMKTRILSELRKLALGDGTSTFRKELQVNYPQLTEDGLKEKSRKIYRQILHDYGRFSILTIDSFVQKVIRSFAFELGLEPGFRVEIRTKKVKEELVRNLELELDHNSVLFQYCLDLVWKRLDKGNSWNYHTDLLELADDIFKEVYLEHQKGVAQLTKVWGPGNEFNKFEEIAKNDDNNFILGISRIAEKLVLAHCSFSLEVEDFQRKSRSSLYKIPSIFQKGFDKNFDSKKLPSIESLLNLKSQPDKWLKNLEGGDYYQVLNPILEELNDFYEEQVGKYIIAEALLKKIPFLRLLHELYTFLKIYREKSGDLLITDTQHLLEGITGDDNLNPSFIWEKIGNLYHNYLLDEFQDTSLSQWHNFKPLIQESISTTPPGIRVENLLVGDIKQSIYRWRNGDWNLLYQKAEQDLGFKNVLNESLEFNYRSHKTIIDFNNHVFGEAPQLIQQELDNIISEKNNKELKFWWESGYKSILKDIYHDSHQKMPPGSSEGGTLQIKIIKKPIEEVEDDETHSQEEGEKNKKDHLLFHSIVEIRRLVEEWKYSYSDICLIVRNNAEVKLAVNKLLENNIPVVSGDALVLGNNKAISLIISTLKYFLSPPFNASLYLATCQILKAELEDKIFPQEELIRTGPKNNIEAENDFRQNLNKAWSEWSSLPLVELFERIIGFYKLNLKVENIPYLLGFRDLLADYTRDGDKGLSSFMDWWDDEGKEKGLAAGNNPNAVQIITIHKAKGLAFRAVLLPLPWPLKSRADHFWVETRDTDFADLIMAPLNFSETLSRTSLGKVYYIELLNSFLDSLNELYVALTRAIEHLFILIPFKNKPNLVDTGDLLLKSVNNFATKKMDKAGNEIMEWGYNTYIPILPLKNEKINLDQILLVSQYPLEGHLIHKVKGKKYISRNGPGTESRSRKGSILHEMLARIDKIQQVESAILEFKSRGLILHSEINEYKTEIVQILQHPELKSLLKKAEKVYSERTILTGQGSVYRPDKVLFCSTETIILDYKFTSKESSAHIEQVKGYAGLLSHMGYPNPRTFLFYAQSHSLKEV